jgi:predicted methyltransferase MtxX (methanogen marker protein 4)
LTFGLLTTFFSCGQPNGTKNIALGTTDTLQANIDKKEKERIEKRKQIEIISNHKVEKLFNEDLVQREIKPRLKNRIMQHQFS